jgi:hypothetical protein
MFNMLNLFRGVPFEKAVEEWARQGDEFIVWREYWNFMDEHSHRIALWGQQQQLHHNPFTRERVREGKPLTPAEWELFFKQYRGVAGDDEKAKVKLQEYLCYQIPFFQIVLWQSKLLDTNMPALEDQLRELNRRFNQKLLSSAEAAEILGYCQRHFERIKKNFTTMKIINGRYRFEEWEVRQFIRTNKVYPERNSP